MGDPNRPATGYPVPQPPPQQPPPAYSNPNGVAVGGVAAAYGYASQPPYQNPNPYYGHPYQQNPHATHRATFIRRVCGALIASFIIAATIIFIVWLVLRPRLPEFRVDYFSCSNLSISSSTSLLAASWEARFHVRNPNKKLTLSYDRIKAAVYYKSESLSDTTLTPFFQGTRNETTITAAFAASGTFVGQSAIDGINSARGGRDGTVVFNVRMLARVRLKSGAWKARTRYLRIYCGDLGVRIPSSGKGSGSLVGGPKQCGVDD